MTRIPLADAHVHLWELDRLRYPWLSPPFDGDGPNGDVQPIARDYGLDDYLADAQGWNVVGLVHVEAGAHPADALAETRWLQALSDQRGLPNAVIAYAALNDPGVAAQLEAHAAHSAVRGVRQIVCWHPDPRRTYAARDVTGDADWRRGFSRLAPLGLSFDLQCYPGQMASMAELIAGHPETAVILNHVGMPPAAEGEELAQWRAGLRALAALPNTSIKLSGAGFIDRQWTPGQIRPYLLEAVEVFGARRCLVASDFPTDKLFGSFGRHLGAYADIFADFSEDERRDLFGRNANRIYRLGLDL